MKRTNNKSFSSLCFAITAETKQDISVQLLDNCELGHFLTAYVDVAIFRFKS